MRHSLDAPMFVLLAFVVFTASAGAQIEIKEPAVNGVPFSVRLNFDLNNFPLGSTAAITAGNPGWLNLAPTTGVLSGKPVIAKDQDYKFTVEVQDPADATKKVTVDYILHGYVNAPPVPSKGECSLSGKPVIGTLLVEGASEISGTAPQPGSSCTARIAVMATAPGAVAGMETELRQASTSNSSVADGKYDVHLLEPLPAGESIFVREVLVNSGGQIDSALTTIKPCAPGATVPNPLKVTSDVTDSAKDISGAAYFPVPQGCTTSLDLMLKSWTPAAEQDIVLASTDTVDSKGGFKITLANSLYAGQQVFVRQTFATGLGRSTGVLVTDAIPVTTVGDWGKVKVYFTSGFLLSQDQSSFSNTSLFLAFTLDKTWIKPGHYGEACSNENPCKDMASTFHSDHGWPLGFNSFFETRLTAIPVTACTTPSTGVGGNAPAPATGSPCETTMMSGAGTPSTVLSDTFLKSQKTARLDVGIYAPWTATAWTYRGTPNALFIAPLAKVGFDTPTGSLSQTVPANVATMTTTTTPMMVTAANSSNFYTFYGFGGRLGHYRMTGLRGEAPELISYLDVLFGPFSNLESFVAPSSNLNPTLAQQSRQRLWRVSMEGVLKIPSTPLVLGFSANVGQETVGLGNNRVTRRAGDDLRFLFGARFDVAKLIAKISQVAP